MADPPDADPWAPIEPPHDAPPSALPPPPSTGAGGWAPPTSPPGWAGAPPPPPTSGAPGFGYDLHLSKGGDARTGTLPLHPMSMGDVLDGAFKLLRADIGTVLLVVAAVVVPLHLVSAFVLREQVSPGLINIFRDPTLAQNQTFSLGDAGASLLTTVLALVTAPLIAGAVSRVCAASYLGQPIGPGEALRSTLRRLPALLAASLLVFLAQVGGFIMCILPSIAFTVLYTVVTPALMIEEIGPIQAMRRSWRLIKPRFWPVLGIVALAWLISSFVGNLIGGAPSAIGTIFGGTYAWLWIAAGAVLASLISAPITAIVDTLVYFDGRIRNEGFDLQVMAQDLERSAPSSS